MYLGVAELAKPAIGGPALRVVKPALLSADEWEVLNFGSVDLGDKRRNVRAVQTAAMMAAHPSFSLPGQMQGRNALDGAYGLLNNDAVTMESLLGPHVKMTLAAAGRIKVVLMVEDSTELDYTAHRSTKGLGPIGDGKEQGLILHSTLAVVPQSREILGLAHAQVVLRQPAPSKNCHWSGSPEAKVWETSAKAVGSPPGKSLWVHVSDRASDSYDYMVACVDRGVHFLFRAYHDRVLQWHEGTPQAGDDQARRLLCFVRSLAPHPNIGYTVQVPARDKKPAREAQVVLQWAPATIPAPPKVPQELRKHAPIPVCLLRVWEPEPPEGVDRVEWVLVSSLPINSTEDAYRTVDWYSCRWICEDYHQCLKTGCKIERTQFDDGADIKRLLGFAAPIAVRLLQLRQAARQTPDVPAANMVDPLMVTMLALRLKKNESGMTVGEFLMGVARLGGHLGRRGDGPPGWRTLWEGWQLLSDLTEGARLIQRKR